MILHVIKMHHNRYCKSLLVIVIVSAYLNFCGKLSFVHMTNYEQSVCNCNDTNFFIETYYQLYVATIVL